MSDAKRMYDMIDRSAPIVPYIHEKTFIQRILPLIDTDKEDVVLDDWFAVAGQPHQVINVIADDETDPSKVLFTVPPILNTLPIIDDADKRASIAAILYEYDAIRTHQHPGMADVHLMQELASKMPLPDDRQMLLTLVRWKIIDDRYDLKAQRFANLKGLTRSDLPGIEEKQTQKGGAVQDESGEFEEL